MSCEMSSRICGDNHASKMCYLDPVAARASFKAQIMTLAAKADAFAGEIIGRNIAVSSEPTVIHHHHGWYNPWYWGHSHRETIIIQKDCSSFSFTPSTKKKKEDNKGNAAIVLAIATATAAVLAWAIGSSSQGIASANEELKDAAEFKSAAEAYERLAATPEEQAFATAARKAADLNARLAGRIKSSHVGDLAINVPLILGSFSVIPWATCTLELAKKGVFESVHQSSCDASTAIAGYAPALLYTGIALLGAKLVKWGYDSAEKTRDAQALRNCVTLLTAPQINVTIGL